MPVPDFQTIMLPLLELFTDGKERSIQETIEALSAQFALTDEEKNELLPSGRQARFDNRAGWARTYLAKAGLLKVTRRAHYQITDRGLQVLQEKPERIDMKYLERFPEYVEFRERRDQAHQKPPRVALGSPRRRRPKKLWRMHTNKSGKT